jgi:hypothetical protein
MKKIALACLFVLLATGASAQDPTTIYDIQMGAVAEGSLVNPCEVVVTAVTYNGIWVAEAPYGAYNGIWVYMGSSDPIDLVPGDIVCVCGEYKEYYDLSEIDIPAAGLYGSVLKTGEMAVPMPSFVTAAELAADGEPWESCAITVTDGMEVTEAPSTYGEWSATALDGSVVMFDDVFYDDSTVMLGDCYNSATVILTYSFGAFKLLAYADGIEVTDCGVDTEDATLSSIKALYR